MIKHVVCYKLKERTMESKQAVKKMFMSMKKEISEIKELNVGLDFLGSERSYDVILEIVFETKEDMNAYQKNPYHVTIVKPFMANARETSVSVDYEF